MMSHTKKQSRLRQLPRNFRDGLGFFTRFPVELSDSGSPLAHTAAVWPVIGFVAALLPAILLEGLASMASTPFLAAVLAVALLTLITGGLHEDGLADAADGLGGGATRDAKMTIMRDSRIGSYGVLALIFAMLVKIGALVALASDPANAAIALLMAAVVSRSAAVWHWHALLPARHDGMSYSAGRPDGIAFLISSAFGLLSVLILVYWFGFSSLLALAVMLVCTLAFTGVCKRQIGGQTGDTIGATQQLAELSLLTGLAVISAV